jgi:hypothetical protein
MLEIERVTGICRERLRPDLYRIPAEFCSDRTLCATDEATLDRVERQLLLACADPGEPD